MSQESLPEEKLLNLIRKKKETNLSSHPATLSAVVNKQSSESGKRSRKDFLKIFNQFLLLVLLGLAGFLVYEMMFEVESIGRPARVVRSGEKTEISFFDRQEEKPFSYYEQQFLKRNIFEAAPKAVDETVKVSLANKFKVVGIVLGRIPEVVLEDVESKKTLFLHQGDRVDGAEVVRIQEGKVILRIDDEEIEIKP
jgi:hypothetical protein